MTVFPTFSDDEVEDFVPDDDIDQDEELQPPTPYGVTWRFDFASGDLALDSSGNTATVSGLGTVTEWINHMLLIRRFESPILDASIGTDLQTLVGSRDNTLAMLRLRKEIVEAILQHDRVTEAEVVDLFPVGGDMYVFVEFTTDDSEQEGVLLSIS